jgi:hypothetical protein
MSRAPKSVSWIALGVTTIFQQIGNKILGYQSLSSTVEDRPIQQLHSPLGSQVGLQSISPQAFGFLQLYPLS